MKNPVSFNLNKIDWNFFGTLTFRKIPPRELQKKCIFHYLRLVAQAFGSNNWKWDIQWAVRHELGEMTGRPHFHYLLKVKDDEVWNNPTAACKMLEALWEVEIAGSCGFADVRKYDSTKSAAEYIMKADQGWFTASANRYEIQKFYFENISHLDIPLLVAPSVLWELAKRKSGSKGTNRRHNGEGLAQFLRTLKAEKSKTKSNPNRQFGSPPEKFVHPHSPFHALKQSLK
jgi:hypothetical protein